MKTNQAREIPQSKWKAAITMLKANGTVRKAIDAEEAKAEPDSEVLTVLRALATIKPNVPFGSAAR